MLLIVLKSYKIIDLNQSANLPLFCSRFETFSPAGNCNNRKEQNVLVLQLF